jgi:DNA-binding response OmpR family regulator
MRILIVEDYEPLRAALNSGLREAGFAVDSAPDGDEGWWYANSNKYDLIILDIMLPGIDGLSLLRRLRAAGRHDHVLLLTARDEVEDRVEGLNLGADDYLVKPFAFPELLARVRALLRRTYSHKNPVLTIGPLEVDTVNRRVRFDGEHIDLTPREYAIIELLAHRSGELVTRTQLWEKVYEFSDNASSNVLDVYISYLRKKLEANGRQRLIHTRRGQGFVLGVEA